MPGLTPQTFTAPTLIHPKEPLSLRRKTKLWIKRCLVASVLLVFLLVSWMLYPEWFKGFGLYNPSFLNENTIGQTMSDKKAAGHLQKILSR